MFRGCYLFKGIGYVLEGTLGLVGKIGKLALSCLFKWQIAESSLSQKTVLPLPASLPFDKKVGERSPVIISVSAPLIKENLFVTAEREQKANFAKLEELFSGFLAEVRATSNVNVQRAKEAHFVEFEELFSGFLEEVRATSNPA